jgi:predicted transcriptional regulator
MDLITRRFLEDRMRQHELAQKADVPQSKISLAERGLIKLRDDEKKRIEEILGPISWQEPQDG